MTGREDVIRVVLCAAYMLLLTLPRGVVRGSGGPAAPVRYRGAGRLIQRFGPGN